MGNVTKIRLTLPGEAGGDRSSCLVRIHPSGPDMGLRYPLLSLSLILGRDPSCEIILDDSSVSRFHARIQPVRGGGYQITDLQSTNGTFINDVRVTEQRLSDGDYVRIGTHIFRYLTGSNVEAQYHEEIYHLTISDALTGVYNKRYFLEFLEHELSRSARYRRPLALLLFDIDHFKAINDRFGHLAGDDTLRELIARVKVAVRREDLLARYGGEEFAVVMPETSRAGAAQLAERLRETVAGRPFPIEGQSYPVTISVGVAATAAGEAGSPEALLQEADANLYQAKRSGRNRVVA